VFSVNGAPGISISRVVAGDYAGLDGKDDNVSSIAVNRVICRIQVGTVAISHKHFTDVVPSSPIMVGTDPM